MSQLELFKTKEQEENLQYAINRFNKRQVKAEERYFNILNILSQNGFIKNKHYVLEGEGEYVTSYKEFDYGSYRENLTEEVLVKSWNGSIRFLYSSYNEYDNKLENRDAMVDMQDGKFNLVQLQGNYRYIKPSTLLSKLDESHIIAKDRFDKANKYNNTVIKVLEDLQTKFPDAKITHSSYDDNITIEFKNGNSVTYKVWNDGSLSEKRCYIKTIQSLNQDDKLKMLQNL